MFNQKLEQLSLLRFRFWLSWKLLKNLTSLSSKQWLISVFFLVCTCDENQSSGRNQTTTAAASSKEVKKKNSDTKSAAALKIAQVFDRTPTDPKFFQRYLTSEYLHFPLDSSNRNKWFFSKWRIPSHVFRNFKLFTPRNKIC